MYWQNIRLLNDIMAYTNIEKLPGILLFVDFEKAFDSIEWNLIFKVLEVFNFGPVIRKSGVLCHIQRRGIGGYEQWFLDKLL